MLMQSKVSMHVETVCRLVLRNPVIHINIDVDVEEMVQDKRGLATYGQIKSYVLEHSGLKVSSLYIAQVKQKNGIIECENYNKPKSEDARQPQCPPEKERAITEALKHYMLCPMPTWNPEWVSDFCRVPSENIPLSAGLRCRPCGLPVRFPPLPGAERSRL